KKKLLGLHHHVKDNYMQNYLSEFCYKFNRRYFGEALFDRLVVTALEKPWYQPYSK
ncbi:MAG: IS1595-like element ISNia2 family transposase, partial [Chitinophagaceae bacterium]